MNFLVWGIYDLFRGGIVRAVLSRVERTDTNHAIVIGCGFLLCIIVSYLLGSINWALVISRIVYHDDIRRYGSGNAGTTNILRTYGRKAAAFTFVGDTLKGTLSILFACVMFGCPRTERYYLFLVAAAYLSAFVCILGHVFPCFSHFKGGKGFATLAGVILVLDPAIFLILFVVYVPFVILSHYISLSSIMVALFYPILLHSFDRVFTGIGLHVLITLLMGILITWCHRSNIKRLLEGTERKFYLIKKKVSEAPSAKARDEE